MEETRLERAQAFVKHPDYCSCAGKYDTDDRVIRRLAYFADAEVAASDAARAALLGECVTVLRNLMADLEYREPDGWMSGQVDAGAVDDARDLLDRIAREGL